MVSGLLAGYLQIIGILLLLVPVRLRGRVHGFLAASVLDGLIESVNAGLQRLVTVTEAVDRLIHLFSVATVYLVDQIAKPAECYRIENTLDPARDGFKKGKKSYCKLEFTR